MSARALMTADPAVVTGEETVRRAAQVMRDRGVGLVPVVDDRAHMHLRGVITDRDIAIRCAAEWHGGDCRVEDHMTIGHLDTVPAEASAAEVIHLMERDQVRRVLVTDCGRLVGVISQADLALKTGPLEPLRVEALLERISAPPISAGTRAANRRALDALVSGRSDGDRAHSGMARE
jgi:CBS domain-containing protein